MRLYPFIPLLVMCYNPLRLHFVLVYRSTMELKRRKRKEVDDTSPYLSICARKHYMHVWHRDMTQPLICVNLHVNGEGEEFNQYKMRSAAYKIRYSKCRINVQNP